MKYETNTEPSLQNLNNYDVPCITCLFTRCGSKLRIPSKVICLKGWTCKYYGYLMTSYYKHPLVTFNNYGCQSRSSRDPQKQQQSYAILGRGSHCVTASFLLKWQWHGLCGVHQLKTGFLVGHCHLKIETSVFKFLTLVCRELYVQRTLCILNMIC